MILSCYRVSFLFCSNSKGCYTMFRCVLWKTIWRNFFPFIKSSLVHPNFVLYIESKEVCVCVWNRNFHTPVFFLKKGIKNFMQIRIRRRGKFILTPKISLRLDDHFFWFETTFFFVYFYMKSQSEPLLVADKTQFPDRKNRFISEKWSIKNVQFVVFFAWKTISNVQADIC